MNTHCIKPALYNQIHEHSQSTEAQRRDKHRETINLSEQEKKTHAENENGTEGSRQHMLILMHEVTQPLDDYATVMKAHRHRDV